jgi:hypothetical protein
LLKPLPAELPDTCVKAGAGTVTGLMLNKALSNGVVCGPMCVWLPTGKLKFAVDSLTGTAKHSSMFNNMTPLIKICMAFLCFNYFFAKLTIPAAS